MAAKVFEGQISHITARILVEFPDGRTSIGTGFLYRLGLKNQPGRSVVVLISNKHVFQDPAGKLTISFNARGIDGEPEYGNIQTFEKGNFNDIYLPHPDNDVDLACIDISAIADRDIYFLSLDEKFLAPIDLDRVLPGSDVIFVGYPENRYDVKHNLPIIRKGAIASFPSVDFNGRPQIVIDAQVFQGSSGSPVFAISGGVYLLLGVVSETMIRHAQLQTIPTGRTGEVVQQILGLGLVVKQAKVIELINMVAELHDTPPPT